MITITTTAVLNKEHAIYLLTCKRFKLVHTFHGQNNHGLGLTKPCAQYSLQSCFPLFSILDCGFVTKITNARSVPHHAKNPYSVTHYLLDLTTFCNNCAILLCQWLCKFACAHIFSELHWIQTKSSFLLQHSFQRICNNGNPFLEFNLSQSHESLREDYRKSQYTVYIEDFLLVGEGLFGKPGMIVFLGFQHGHCHNHSLIQVKGTSNNFLELS